jgi:zinc protease
MMFKGNKKFRSAAEVQKAYLDLGVTNWNGSTGAEKVNYYFTVPADKARQGLEFWSWAVREPNLDPQELAREIQVVSAEMAGDLADPARVVQAAVDKALFPAFPWRRDPLGDPEVIRSCTVDQLRAIRTPITSRTTRPCS